MHPSKKVRQPDSSASDPHRRKHRVQEDDNISSERSRNNTRSGDSGKEDDDADLQQLGDKDLATVLASEVMVFLFLNFQYLIFNSRSVLAGIQSAGLQGMMSEMSGLLLVWKLMECPLETRKTIFKLLRTTSRIHQVLTMTTTWMWTLKTFRLKETRYNPHSSSRSLSFLCIT